MKPTDVTVEFKHWMIEQVQRGVSPQALLAPMVAVGWDEQAAVHAVRTTLREFLAEQARRQGPPLATKLPAPSGLGGRAVVNAGDREVQVLASMRLPRVVVFGSLLADDECDELVSLSRARIGRSAVANLETGTLDVHEGRTSEGTFFTRSQNELCTRIEARIAALLDWPVENGEGLQVLHYGPGAEYRPHYDYFDPAKPGAGAILQRGGQRLASLVMYLNTPRRGGATTFPDVGFEVSPIKGNAVFFSYDSPHPATRSLHGGAPVLEGEKWVATKWLRERRHD